MEILQAAVLGIIQGLTEFLPVSSTGHLILAEKLFELSSDKFGLPFDAALHMGTFLALVVFFRKEILGYLTAFRSSLEKMFVVARERISDVATTRQGWSHDDSKFTAQEKLVLIIIFSTIPAAILGLLLEKKAETVFRSPLLIALMLVLFCIPMILAEKLGKQKMNLEKVTLKDGLVIGFAQAIALIPGVSRSGITISAGMLAGLNRISATRFAFLLSIPVVFGAGAKKLLETFLGIIHGVVLFSELTYFATGMVFSFIFGYLAVKFLVSYLSKHGLWGFVWYRVILAILVILFTLF